MVFARLRNPVFPHHPVPCPERALFFYLEKRYLFVSSSCCQFLCIECRRKSLPTMRLSKMFAALGNVSRLSRHIAFAGLAHARLRRRCVRRVCIRVASVNVLDPLYAGRRCQPTLASRDTEKSAGPAECLRFEAWKLYKWIGRK